jgi:23S rRNA (cytidine1920-2'-O)/16S rRNA (cytidine1409-2'-O)-methyltransferase
MVYYMTRLDKELHSRGLTKSRSVAADLIAEGKVLVNGILCEKSAHLVFAEDSLEITQSPKYVSRGGLKLEHALRTFGVELSGKVCLDVGASTGGFTDCMLQEGASRVYAIDVGTNQLDESLRGDRRVISTERCDIRGAIIPPEVAFTAIDVSFISVKLILPELRKFMRPEGEAVVLVKPQFECGIRHKGVITEEKVRKRILDEVRIFTEGLGLDVGGIIKSPILGKGGNQEFLMWVKHEDIRRSKRA